MSKKKSEDSDKSAEQQALERRVDAMMSVEPADNKATPAPAIKKLHQDAAPISTKLEPIKHGSQPTAPILPARLLKTIGANKTVKAAKAKTSEPSLSVKLPDIAQFKEVEAGQAETAVVEGNKPPQAKPASKSVSITVTHETADKPDDDQASDDSGAKAAIPEDSLPTADQPRQPNEQTNDILEDSETDEAVDDIVAHEGDTQLAVEDAIARQRAEAAEAHQPGLLHAFFTSPWTWLFIIGTLGVVYAWYH